MTYVSGGEETEVLDLEKAGLAFVSFTEGWEGALCFAARNDTDLGVYKYWTSGDMLYLSGYTPDSGEADSETMCRKETARLAALGLAALPDWENA